MNSQIIHGNRQAVTSQEDSLGPIPKDRFGPGKREGRQHIAGIRTGRPWAKIRRHAVAFSPDGTRLATGSTGSTDGTARLWRVNTEDLAALACEIVSHNLTFAQWRQYLGEAPYRATCPTVPLDPAELLLAAEASALAGGTEQAEAFFAHAVALATETYNRELSNSVCRSGSIDGFADVVLPACEHAVSLADDEDLASARDSRGLARALTRDYAGAIEDLQFYVEWAQGNDIDEELVVRREAWIAELEAGRNPFDEETLQALRYE